MLESVVSWGLQIAKIPWDPVCCVLALTKCSFWIHLRFLPSFSDCCASFCQPVQVSWASLGSPWQSPALIRFCSSSCFTTNGSFPSCSQPPDGTHPRVRLRAAQEASRCVSDWQTEHRWHTWSTHLPRNSCGFWELQPAVLGAIFDAPLSIQEAEVKESFRDNIITDLLWVGPSSSILCGWLGFSISKFPPWKTDTKINIEKLKLGCTGSHLSSYLRSVYS